MNKPNMSHAVNSIHLNELLVEWFQIREKELLSKIGELELKIQSNILDNDGLGDSDYSD